MSPDSERELRRLLHLVVDAALSANDALDRHDAESLQRAMNALARNTAHAQRLAARQGEGEP